VRSEVISELLEKSDETLWRRIGMRYPRFGAAGLHLQNILNRLRFSLLELS